MTTKIVQTVRDTRVDPARLPSIDVTGSQRPAPRRRQRPERPDAQRRLEIAEWARAAFPPNPTVAAARALRDQAARDRVAKRYGGPPAPPLSLRRRWGAYLLARGATRLTTAQARSLRRRSTVQEIHELSVTEARMIGWS